MARPSEGLPGAWPAALSPAIIAHQRTLAAPRLAPDGRRLAYVAEYDARADLHVLPEDGWPVQITADQAVAGGSYAWSPDGAQIVFTAAGDGQLWLCPAAGGPPRRLTHGEGRHHTPRFSPDGQHISCLCDRGDEIDVLVVARDGRWQRALNRGDDLPMDPTWSPDGGRVIWHAYPNRLMPWDQSALVVAAVAGGAPRTIAAGDRVAYANARFAPDGRRIVCLCDRAGALNITEMAPDGSDQRLLHEDRWEHGEPAYAPDGRAIVYTRNVDGDYSLWMYPQRRWPAAPAGRPAGSRHRAGLDAGRPGGRLPVRQPGRPARHLARRGRHRPAATAHHLRPGRHRERRAGHAGTRHLDERGRFPGAWPPLPTAAVGARPARVPGGHPRRTDEPVAQRLVRPAPASGPARLGRHPAQLSRLARLRAGLPRGALRRLGRRATWTTTSGPSTTAPGGASSGATASSPGAGAPAGTRRSSA